MADHDDAGYRHAAEIAATLRGVASELVVVEAVEGKDAADHFGGGHALEEFVEADLGEAAEETTGPADTLPRPIDWRQLCSRKLDDEDWLVEDFARRHDRHLHRRPLQVGQVAVHVLRGGLLGPWRRPVDGPSTTTCVLGYFDMEMTEDDVHERAEDFGLEPDHLANFRYYLLPNLPPLDTADGGRAVLEVLRRDAVTAAVFDTFGRTVEGEENGADTIAAYNRHTANPIRAAGIASARLDHVGHANQNRARGSSGKGADIDVAWVLTRGEGNGVTLDHHGISRLRWVPRRPRPHPHRRTTGPLRTRRPDVAGRHEGHCRGARTARRTDDARLPQGVRHPPRRRAGTIQRRCPSRSTLALGVHLRCQVHAQVHVGAGAGSTRCSAHLRSRCMHRDLTSGPFLFAIAIAAVDPAVGFSL